MSFNSLQFILLLVVVVLTYWRLRLRGQNRLLLVASYVFYGWWDWRFLVLLIVTTVVDFAIGIRIEEAVGERAKRVWLVSQLVFNLGILAFFKYANFFIDSAQQVADALGLEWSAPVLRIILPVGISFFVFHEISYAVDIFRGRLRAERNLATYALFIAYFPLLAAGPIERAWHLLPQLRTERRRPNRDQVYSGIVLIITGIFKKVVIADSVAVVANSVFARPEGRGFIPSAVGAVAFAIQIYGDFSGYTDVARGTSRLLGIEVFRNFEQPYLSTSITQFWRTWHISLSSWLHDYLYIPLGGNQRGRFATYRNLFLVMLIGGLWHGAVPDHTRMPVRAAPTRAPWATGDHWSGRSTSRRRSTRSIASTRAARRPTVR
ncbi:MAG: MBOAT family O-acyltransferase, partial [Actinomycetota bacterium]